MCYLNLALRGLYCLVLSGLLSCGAPNDKAASPQEPEPATFQQPTPATDRGSAVAAMVEEDRDSLPPQTLPPEEYEGMNSYQNVRFFPRRPYGEENLEFWDWPADTLIKALNCHEINPFKELLRNLPPDSIVKATWAGLQISPNFDRSAIKAFIQDKGFEPNSLIDSGTIMGMGIFIGDAYPMFWNYKAVNFMFSIIDEDWNAYRFNAYLIFDSRGYFVREIYSDRGSSEGVVSQNGKWMLVQEEDPETFQQYKEEYGFEFEKPVPSNLLLYNLESGKLVFEERAEVEEYDILTAYYSLHDYFLSTVDTKGAQRLTFYKPNENLKYVIDFSKLKQYTESSNRTRDYFNNSFKVAITPEGGTRSQQWAIEGWKKHKWEYDTLYLDKDLIGAPFLK